VKENLHNSQESSNKLFEIKSKVLRGSSISSAEIVFVCGFKEKSILAIAILISLKKLHIKERCLLETMTNISISINRGFQEEVLGFSELIVYFPPKYQKPRIYKLILFLAPYSPVAMNLKSALESNGIESKHGFKSMYLELSKSSQSMEKMLASYYSRVQ
jgi:hypothetical protein